MKTNIKAVIAVIIVAMLVTGNAFAGTECGFSGGRDKHSKAKDVITHELNLSADQQNRLEQERTAHRKAMETLQSALKEKKRELRETIAKPGITRELVAPILTQINKLESDMASRRVDGIFAVKGILSPEQFSKLQSMKEKRMHNENKKHGVNE